MQLVASVRTNTNLPFKFPQTAFLICRFLTALETTAETQLIEKITLLGAALQNYT